MTKLIAARLAPPPPTPAPAPPPPASAPAPSPAARPAPPEAAKPDASAEREAVKAMKIKEIKSELTSLGAEQRGLLEKDLSLIHI